MLLQGDQGNSPLGTSAALSRRCCGAEQSPAGMEHAGAEIQDDGGYQLASAVSAAPRQSHQHCTEAYRAGNAKHDEDVRLLGDIQLLPRVEDTTWAEAKPGLPDRETIDAVAPNEPKLALRKGKDLDITCCDGHGEWNATGQSIGQIVSVPWKSACPKGSAMLIIQNSVPQVNRPFSG